MTRASLRLGATSVFALAAFAATPAHAAGTASGAQITNTVTVNYTVGGVAQTALTASDTFTVDRKINLTVTEVGGTTTSVSPGQTNAVDTFTVTNLSNATLDLALAVAQQTGGAGAHSNTDTFDANNVRIYVDTNGNGTYDAGDTLVTYLDEVLADQSKTVFVVSDIPLGKATGDVAAFTLTATGREGGVSGTMGAALSQTTGANTSGVDTVFADGAGSGDNARDAAYGAKGDYTVQAAALTVTKVSSVISDPFNGTSNPKMIPGAVVQYCITVKNASGGAAAAAVAISDTLPTTTTYQTSFGVVVNGTVTGTTCNADGNLVGAQAAGVVTGLIPTVAAGDARTVVFRVTVN